ncbi:MAG: DegV family protein [Anaerolineales bacterium]|nr:DegV family protein [Anaerolineales bacterium]MCB9127499.1 DegV family protein [Ardenticatenales bacterium]
MTKPIIVTDSTADLSAEDRLRYGIRVVPLSVRMDGIEYVDDDSLPTKRFNELLQQPETRPFTIPPSPERFRAIYESSCYQPGGDIISIHLSSKLSNTVRNARQAADQMLGRCTVHVVDSGAASVGLGILTKQAAIMAEEGHTAETIVRKLRGMVNHIYVVFFVESLEFLERGGRIGKAQALLGTMLNIKPMLIIEEGEIEPLEKVRTRARAVERLADFVAEFGHVESLTIMHHQADSIEIEGLIERIEGAFDGDVEISVAKYGPVLAAHIGPDALGVVVFEGADDYWG